MKKTTIFLLTMLSIFLFIKEGASQGDTSESDARSAALENNDRPKEPDTQQGDVPVGGGGGMGDMAILINMPNDGIITNRNFVLYWKDTLSKSSVPYTVNLMNDDEGVVIFSATTPSDEILITVEDFNLKPDLDYTLTVSREVNGRKNSSKEAKIRIIEGDKFKELENQLRESEDYKSADPFTKSIMMAFRMQWNKLYLEAQKKYISAIKAAPNDRDATTAINMLHVMRASKF